MRVSIAVRSAFAALYPIALVALAGCGGATPEAKDADEAPSKPESKPADPAPAATAAAPASDEAPAAAPAASAASPPAAAGDPGASGGDDPWMASHQMSPKDVLAAVRPAQAKAQKCFHDGLKRDPSASGEVKIRFVITNAGAVRVWRDEGSSMSDEDVTTCVGDLIKTLKFPKQKSPGDAWGVYTAKFGN